ncbi:hypothetical protein D9M69_460940 [compost metagenome]
MTWLDAYDGRTLACGFQDGNILRRSWDVSVSWRGYGELAANALSAQAGHAGGMTSLRKSPSMGSKALGATQAVAPLE